MFVLRIIVWGNNASSFIQDFLPPRTNYTRNSGYAFGFFTQNRYCSIHTWQRRLLIILTIAEGTSYFTLFRLGAKRRRSWCIVVAMDEPAGTSIAAVASQEESTVHIVGVEAGITVPTGPLYEVPVNVHDDGVAIIRSWWSLVPASVVYVCSSVVSTCRRCSSATPPSRAVENYNSGIQSTVTEEIVGAEDYI